MTQADVADKAAFVRAALEGLESLPQDSLESFLADPRNLPSALHWMQTAIQALVDIGLIVVSARGLPTPRSSSEVLERLEEAGALPPWARPSVSGRSSASEIASSTSTAASIPKSSTASSSKTEATWWSCSTCSSGPSRASIPPLTTEHIAAVDDAAT